MEFDLMTGGKSWANAATLATRLQSAGFSGMLFTETSQVPWMQISAAAMAAPEMFFTTGIAVAFPRSPMVSAAVAHEIAGNTGGRFRLGLGSQVKAHVARRYSSEFDRPAARLRDYVLATKACLRALDGLEKLDHVGEFYQHTLLPNAWAPRPHGHEVPVDISAVGPLMTRVAGAVADGVHVHPLHSMHYIESRLLPDLQIGASETGRSIEDVALIVPVFACPGDTREEREPYIKRAREQIAFYGSTPNYAFQFDDLGFDGTTANIRQRMKEGRLDELGELITDEMLDHFALVCSWDDLADQLVDRYHEVADRVVMYLGEPQLETDDNHLQRWGDVARAVRQHR